MRVISFAKNRVTDSTYVSKMEALEAVCAAHGVTTNFEVLPKGGNYRDICRTKPTYIYNRLIKLEEDLLWIDADTRVTYIDPDLTSLTPIAGRCKQSDIFMVASVVLYRFLPETLTVLQDAARFVKEQPDIMDHFALLLALKDHRDWITPLTDAQIRFTDGSSRKAYGVKKALKDGTRRR